MAKISTSKNSQKQLSNYLVFAVTMSSIEEAIKKDIKDKGIEGKEISVYVNVEQKAAYYTVDGQGSDDYRIDLNTL